jgi:hypothetical protein
LKKLKFSEKNKNAKSIVTGNEYSELLKERYDASSKNFWSSSALLQPKKTDEDDILDDEGKE